MRGTGIAQAGMARVCGRRKGVDWRLSYQSKWELSKCRECLELVYRDVTQQMHSSKRICAACKRRRHLTYQVLNLSGGGVGNKVVLRTRLVRHCNVRGATSDRLLLILGSRDSQIEQNSYIVKYYCGRSQFFAQLP